MQGDSPCLPFTLCTCLKQGDILPEGVMAHLFPGPESWRLRCKSGFSTFVLTLKPIARLQIRWFSRNSATFLDCFYFLRTIFHQENEYRKLTKETTTSLVTLQNVGALNSASFTQSAIQHSPPGETLAGYMVGHPAGLLHRCPQREIS